MVTALDCSCASLAGHHMPVLGRPKYKSLYFKKALSHEGVKSRDQAFFHFKLLRIEGLFDMRLCWWMYQKVIFLRCKICFGFECVCLLCYHFSLVCFVFDDWVLPYGSLVIGFVGVLSGLFVCLCHLFGALVIGFVRVHSGFCVS